MAIAPDNAEKSVVPQDTVSRGLAFCGRIS